MLPLTSHSASLEQHKYTHTCRKRSVFLPSNDQEDYSAERTSVKEILKWVAYLNIEIDFVCILEHLHLSISVLQIYAFHWPFVGGSCHFYVISVLQAYISYKVLYEIKKCIFLWCKSCFSFQNDYSQSDYCSMITTYFVHTTVF